MSAHDEMYKKREAERREMISAAADVNTLRTKLRDAEIHLVKARAEFLDTDRKFQQLLAADSAGVLGNVAQVEHAGTEAKP
jgi:hypothetical protein